MIFTKNINDLIWKRRNKVIDHDLNDLPIRLRQVNIDKGLKMTRGWRLYLKKHRNLSSYCSGDALINRRILITKTRNTDSLSSKNVSSHHLIEVWSFGPFYDRTAKTTDNQPDLRQTLIYRLTEWWSFFRMEWNYSKTSTCGHLCKVDTHLFWTPLGPPELFLLEINLCNMDTSLLWTVDTFFQSHAW